MADWNWDRFNDDDDENEEDEGFQRWQWGTRDGLVFLIDCSKNMFERGDSEETCFEVCIKCAKSVIQNKIISSDRDLLGIVFFATDKSNPEEFKHVYVLHDLAQPGAERVLELEAFLEDNESDDFESKFGHNNDYSLSDAFWACSNLFSKCPQKLGYKRVMLFTCNDNPHERKDALQRQAAAKAEDLHQNGINVELMHMNTAKTVFDVNVFYKNLLFPDEDENVILPDASEKFDELLTRVRSKDHKKRPLSRLPLKIGDGLSLSVGVYNLVRPCRKPAAVKLYKKTNQEVSTKTQVMLAETVEVLNPKMDMKKSQTYGGEQIAFEPEEVAEIKTFGTSGLELMGFKPRSTLKKYFHIKPAQFLYPDEKNIEGSTTFFSALLRKSLQRDVVAICKYIPRKNTPPRFVALIPQEEELDEHNVQTTPPGFHLIFLPFSDDFRNVKMPKNLPRANTEQIDKAKDLVKKLQFAFSSDDFDNPALQTHYCAVEAMALDRDEPEKVVDYTLPDTEKMDKRAGQLMKEFKDLVFPEGYVPGAKKRGGGGGGAGADKKPKAEPADLDIEAEAKAGRLAKLTVAVLRDCIKELRITNAGSRKAELIEAINDHFGI